MKKKQIEKRILVTGRQCTHFRDNRYRWGEIVQILKDEHITLQDTDILEVGYTDEYQDGDSARDPYHDLTVTRVREETDKEFEKRKNNIIEDKKRSRQLRHKQYLKLKKEFENEENEKFIQIYIVNKRE